MFLLALVVAFSASVICGEKLKSKPPAIRQHLEKLSQGGLFHDMLTYLKTIEAQYGNLAIDNVAPSLYSYQGVAHYTTLKTEEALKSFELSVKHQPADSRAWINLGEIQVQTFKLDESVISFTKSYEIGDFNSLPRILRSKGWSGSWKAFEFYCSKIEKLADLCVTTGKCSIDSSGGLEYTDSGGSHIKLLNSLTPNAKVAQNVVPNVQPSADWLALAGSKVGGHSNDRRHNHNIQIIFQNSGDLSSATQRDTHFIGTKKRIKLGIISSDFGVHPVATLIRGFVQFLDRSRFELFCFGLHPAMSWWGQNISGALGCVLLSDSCVVVAI